MRDVTVTVTSVGRMAACLSQLPANAVAAEQLSPSDPSPLHAALTHSQDLAHHLAPAGVVQRDIFSGFLHGGGRSCSLQWFDYLLYESCGNPSPLGLERSPFQAPSPQLHFSWRAASLQLA